MNTFSLEKEKTQKKVNINLGFKMFLEKPRAIFFSRENTGEAVEEEINANKHHLWNDDENDEYFTPFETKKTKRDYYFYYDYFDDDEQ